MIRSRITHSLPNHLTPPPKPCGQRKRQTATPTNKQKRNPDCEIGTNEVPAETSTEDLRHVENPATVTSADDRGQRESRKRTAESRAAETSTVDLRHVENPVTATSADELCDIDAIRSKLDELAEAVTQARAAAHEADRNNTEPQAEPAAENPGSLSPQKQAALEALLIGKTMTAAAEIVGVNRRTIARWKQESSFQAELHRCQRYLATKVRTRMADLADDSLETIVYWIQQGDAQTALELLAAVQVLNGAPLETIDDAYAQTTPDAAAPLTQLTSFAPLTQANSTPEGVWAPIQFVVPEAATSTSGTVPPSCDRMANSGASVASAAPPPAGDQPSTSHTVKPQIAATTFDLADLSLRQQQAVSELLAGQSLAEVAATIGVSNYTVERWLHCDAAFRQVLRAGRREQTECLQTKLLNLCQRAVQVLKVALKQRRDRRVAFAILRGIGVLR